MIEDVREQAIRFALSELARENVTPDIDLQSPLSLVESELVDMVSLYNGKETASEVKRHFINASLA